MAREPSFEVRTAADVDSSDVLLVGLADVGAASLTAIDYLITHLETTQIGSVATRNLPSVTPVEEGTPRRPIRLYRVDDAPIMILVSEVFIPVSVAEIFVDALLDWSSGRDIDEIGVLHSTPYPHAEDEHDVFYAATPSFRRDHFSDEAAGIEPLPGGVVDGTTGELLGRGIGTPRPSVGAFVTPTHLPGPDIDAALRLLEGVESCYPIEVDERELRQRSEEMKRYFEELASRLATLKQEEQSIERRDFPEDRMYM
ncbi:proteasome assembly chaperone family protein [Halopiger xanaduensis]|uniref:Proteasome assembly chaperone family protein n=1 Tax=Halopiger xanaduensis (strain DSM 18323 / JCM 14033 / SH-6) TaxID=797210 RepID=F8DE69_HALXS|nr:PAC2 family protein [Halopiger xanaduensis]AEH39345.1 protein of unknown function DUF75 [Halopiger xanaduensis SH-6]